MLWEIKVIFRSTANVEYHYIPDRLLMTQVEKVVVQENKTAIHIVSSFYWLGSCFQIVCHREESFGSGVSCQYYFGMAGEYSFSVVTAGLLTGRIRL